MAEWFIIVVSHPRDNGVASIYHYIFMVVLQLSTISHSSPTESWQLSHCDPTESHTLIL